MTPKPDMPLMQFFNDVYAPLRLLHASHATFVQYRVAIKSFERFLQRTPMLSDLTEEMVTGLMAFILDEGKSEVTANGKANYLKTLARLAKRKKYLEEDLSAVEKVRVRRRLPTAWSDAEMKLIIQSCRLCEGRLAGVPANLWWVAFVLTAYDTGLRRRALLAIRFDEIDFEQGLLRVPAENMKTAVEQVFKLHPQTIEAILATVPPDREFAFPIHYKHLRCFYVRFKAILKRAGLPYGRGDMVHKLRRTCASHIAANAGEGLAVKQLGHLDPTCIKRYVDPRFTASHDLVGLLPRPAWDNPREVTVTRDDGPVYHLGQPLKIILPTDGLGHPGALDRIMATNDVTPDDLREAISEMGLSIVEFADHARVGRSRLYSVLNGERPLTRDFERRIRAGLGIGPPTRDGAKSRPIPRRFLPTAMPPVDTRPGEHPMLGAEPFSLAAEFISERFGIAAAMYRNRMKSNFRAVLAIDGALSVRDFDAEATIAEVCRAEEAGDIGHKTAEGYRSVVRAFLFWLVEQRGVHYFARVLPRLNRHMTRAARKMELVRRGRKEGAA